ncbi:hypothetical protein ACI797_07495 [Geodermatophilus sp. SYSU D00691]
MGLAVTAGCGIAADARAAAAAPATSDGGPFPYQIGVVRDRNVVVVIESTGWTERAEVALELALQRALPGAQGRCADGVLPCPRPTPSTTGPGPFDLAPDPLLAEADWARIARVANHPVVSGSPPEQLAECLTVLPAPEATEVRAVAFETPTHPDTGLNQYVLRYADDAAATTAVAGLRDQFLACPDRIARGEVAVQLHEHRASDRDGWWTVDEAFVGDRAFPGREPLTGG